MRALFQDRRRKITLAFIFYLLFFSTEVQANECLPKNELRKIIEQSFYSLYQWQNYWYGYYYDIDLESHIRHNGRMVVDFLSLKRDQPHRFCVSRKNSVLTQFGAYVRGIDLIYTGKILNRKASMLATFGDASEKAGEAWHDFNREIGYRLSVSLNNKLLKSMAPKILPNEKLHNYIIKTIALSKHKHLFREGIVVGTPREGDPSFLIASKNFKNLFLMSSIQFDPKKEGAYGEIYSWSVYIYTENLAIKQKRIEKIDNIKKHVIDRLRNDHFVIDCDEC